MQPAEVQPFNEMYLMCRLRVRQGRQTLCLWKRNQLEVKTNASRRPCGKVSQMLVFVSSFTPVPSFVKEEHRRRRLSAICIPETHEANLQEMGPASRLPWQPCVDLPDAAIYWCRAPSRPRLHSAKIQLEFALRKGR